MATKYGGCLRFFITAISLVVLTFLVSVLLPENPSQYGFFSVLPAIFLVVYIFITKRILESLILASLMCFVFADGTNFFYEFSSTFAKVLMDEDTVWLIMVCGLMGSIIRLIEKAGGSFAFGEFVAKYAKTRRSTLLWTFIMGVVVFIDDYLNSLTVGSCMVPVSDKKRIPREMLAYVVDSTAAPMCVLIPISTWAVFASRLFVVNGVTTEANAMSFFISTIPYNFYAWFATFIVILVILGIIPPIFRMKRAEERVAEGGPLAPIGSEKIDIRAGKALTPVENPRILNFFLPIIILIGATIYFDIDMQKSVLVTIAAMFLLYVPQGLMTAEEFADDCVEGLSNMLMPLLLMVLAFVFGAGADKILFTQTVIGWVVPWMQETPELMPLLIFLVLSITEFITGTNWGMYIIALPIVVPLTQAVGGDPVLSVAAVLSAGVFGSHICFYSDATVVTSSACGCNNFYHGLTQIPYGLIGAVMSAVAFLIAGFVIN